MGLHWGNALLAWVLAIPTIPPPPSDEVSAVGGGLFYALLAVGALLFLVAFIYGRRKGS